MRHPVAAVWTGRRRGLMGSQVLHCCPCFLSPSPALSTHCYGAQSVSLTQKGILEPRIWRIEAHRHVEVTQTVLQLQIPRGRWVMEK